MSKKCLAPAFMYSSILVMQSSGVPATENSMAASLGFSSQDFRNFSTHSVSGARVSLNSVEWQKSVCTAYGEGSTHDKI